MQIFNPNPNLDLWPFNPKTMSTVGYPKIIPYTVLTLWDHSFLSYAADEQADNKQMEPNIIPMPTDRVGMGTGNC